MSGEPDGDVLLCRCQELTRREVRDAISGPGRSLREIKLAPGPGDSPAGGGLYH